MTTKDAVESKTEALMKRQGYRNKKNVTQMRPRCFKKETATLIFGEYFGPIVQDKRNGEGIFVWYVIADTGMMDSWLKVSGKTMNSTGMPRFNSIFPICQSRWIPSKPQR